MSINTTALSERLDALLQTPTAAAWEELLYALHAWPTERPEALTALAELCLPRLSRWPHWVQRTPMRGWLEPELEGRRPHPLMTLARAPRGWDLSVSVIMGEAVNRRGKRVLGDLYALGGVVKALFEGGLREIAAQGHAEAGPCDVEITLGAIHRGWLVDERHVDLRLDAPSDLRPEMFTEALSGMRSPEGEPWGSFRASVAYEESPELPPWKLGSIWAYQAHPDVGAPDLDEAAAPPVRGGRTRIPFPSRGRALVKADGHTDLTELARSKSKPTRVIRRLERDIEGFLTEVEAPDEDLLLWRGDDRYELYRLTNGARLCVWRWEAEGSPPLPLRLERRRLENVGDTPLTIARIRYTLDLGDAFRAWRRAEDELIIQRVEQLAPNPRALPCVDLEREEAATWTLMRLRELGLWRPEALRGEALAAELTHWRPEMSKGDRARVLFRAMSAFGEITHPYAQEALVGLLLLDPPRARACRRALDALVERGLLEWTPEATPEGRALALLIFGWATGLDWKAERLGAALSTVLLDLDAVEELYCDDRTLGLRTLEVAWGRD